MRDDETRVCRLCGGDPKPKSEFYSYKQKQRNGKVLTLTRTECRRCQDGRTRKYHRDNRDRYMLNNCRRGDRENGLATVITREDLRHLMVQACHYCGQNDGKVGVDRVDNSRGHSLENCVPCCIRCNCLKRDMPTVAWQFLVPYVKQAHDLGLFGEWIGHNVGSQIRGNRRSLQPKPEDRRFRTAPTGTS
jgi:hypothetical protein